MLSPCLLHVVAKQVLLGERDALQQQVDELQGRTMQLQELSDGQQEVRAGMLSSIPAGRGVDGAKGALVMPAMGVRRGWGGWDASTQARA